ncbi:MAG: hypothetical protein ACOYON_02285 [Fimbriimonas sp.]
MLQVILTDQNYAIAATLAEREHQSVSAWLNHMIEANAPTLPVGTATPERRTTSQWLEQLEGRLK